jgi:hypothetical protein
MPGGGPSPNAVLVIRADAYPITDVLEPLDALTPLLDRRIDKRPEPLYSSAYWYPHQGSEIYGVALVEWEQDLKGSGIEDMKNRYFVEVYAKDEACSLCTAVKSSLAKHHIQFFSA